MFAAIDWLLKQASHYLSSGLTALIHTVAGVSGVDSSFLENAHYKSTVDFFFYDTMKIFLMLSIIIFIVSFIRGFFPLKGPKGSLAKEKRGDFWETCLPRFWGL